MVVATKKNATEIAKHLLLSDRGNTSRCHALVAAVLNKSVTMINSLLDAGVIMSYNAFVSAAYVHSSEVFDILMSRKKTIIYVQILYLIIQRQTREL